MEKIGEYSIEVNNNTKEKSKFIDQIVQDDMNTSCNEIISDGLKPLPGTVKDFFYGTTIFITGASGFLGKVLLEKLLRECDDIKCVYILLRGKRGLTTEQRYKELMKNIVFEKIRSKWPERLEKVILLEGDIAQPDLGLSADDRKRLEQEVDIVFHSAASIRFVEPLIEALTLNTLGMKKMLKLCHNMKRLKSMVHVSTAYCNCDSNTHIEEKFYPVGHDPDALLQCVTSLPPELFDVLAPRIQGGHPNTYTLTKALAEAVILKHGSGLPICIIRPSIGSLMGIYQGTVRTGVSVKEGIMDLIPVDMAVNACIGVAWHHTKNPSGTPKIYNCTSGGVNPLTWEELTKYVVEHGRENPSKYVMMYPNFELTTNRLKNLLWEMATHYVPSMFFDVLLRVQGKKPMMMKLSRRIKMAMSTGEYFTTQEFQYSTDNMKSLIRDLEKNNEHVQFCCDVRKLDWKAYMHWYVIGIRKYILKDAMDSLPMAKKKLQRLFWVQQFLQLMSGYYIFRCLFHRR